MFFSLLLFTFIVLCAVCFVCGDCLSCCRWSSSCQSRSSSEDVKNRDATVWECWCFSMSAETEIKRERERERKERGGRATLCVNGLVFYVTPFGGNVNLPHLPQKLTPLLGARPGIETGTSRFPVLIGTNMLLTKNCLF